MTLLWENLVPSQHGQGKAKGLLEEFKWAFFTDTTLRNLCCFVFHVTETWQDLYIWNLKFYSSEPDCRFHLYQQRT